MDTTVYDKAREIAWRRGYQAGLVPDERKDLAHDVIARYLETWPGDTAPDNPSAWLETAIRNAIIDRKRAEQRHPQDLFALDGEDPVALVVAALRLSIGVSAPAVAGDLLDRVFGLIPPDDAELLRSRYLGGMPAQVLAERLRMSVATVDQRTTRAKAKLRAALALHPDLVEELHRAHPKLY